MMKHNGGRQGPPWCTRDVNPFLETPTLAQVEIDTSDQGSLERSIIYPRSISFESQHIHRDDPCYSQGHEH